MAHQILAGDRKMDFKNKIVLITGASSGIGEALAIQFLNSGAIVIGTSRKTDSLQGLKNKFPDRFFAMELDLEKTETISTKIAEIISRHQRIDILINNGGVSQRSNALDTSMEIDRKIMEVNYFGNIAMTKAVVPYLRKQKSGQIIVISSIAGKFGFYLRSAYSAAKHALHGFYESLRLEEEDNGIKVLMVCPGKVVTNISYNALKGDGSTHNTMDKQQAEGVSAEICAQQIIKGIENNKEEIFIGGREIKAVKVKRLFPKLFSKIIRKQPRE